MRRHVVPLTPADAGGLGVCAACTRWTLDPVAGRAETDARAANRAWIEEVSRDWGTCGLLLRLDDVREGPVAAHALFAPAALAPGTGTFATSPASPDAVVLLALRVAPSYAGRGLGRHLVQAVAKDLLARDQTALEAFADTRTPSAPCLLPADFLLACGFGVHRAHARTPRLRMDLSTTVRWREGVGAVVSRLAPRRERAPGLGHQPRG